jgi:hypothetical protein
MPAPPRPAKPVGEAAEPLRAAGFRHFLPIANSEIDKYFGTQS